MPTNDSDTSDDDSTIYTTTNVLLGYASTEPTDDSFSQLGGYPSWLDDISAPSAELAKCKICNGMMTLLLQLNGDLPEKFPGHERKLYMFSCKRKACRKKEGTVRAVRGVRVPKGSTSTAKAKGKTTRTQSPPPQQPPPAPNLGSSLFNSTFVSNTSTGNPFSSPSAFQSPPNNPFAPSQPPSTTSPFSTLASKPPQPPTPDLPTSFAEKARISTPAPAPSIKEPWPLQSSLPPPYPSYHLDADYETLDPSPPSSTNAAIDTTTESSSKDDEKDAFESTIDKTFQKFADRLAQNPEQVLRYEFGGIPLLYSKNDTVGKTFSNSHSQTEGGGSKVKTIAQESGNIPKCTNCNSKRVFELQLVPHAIAELEIEEEGLEGMEWGTVILGVCERDCGERGVEDGKVGWVEEWVGVQWEETGEVRTG